jgi:uncharacterized protein YndB with AHSA1/START domain
MATPSQYRAGASVVIRTTPEAAFDAWLDPGKAVRFLAPNILTVGAFDNDPREGGDFRLVMQEGDIQIEHVGRYIVIERPRRLIFTWVSPGTDHRLSLVTVVFTPTDNGVRIDIDHEGLPDGERAGRHERGWASILDKLVQLNL